MQKLCLTMHDAQKMLLEVRAEGRHYYESEVFRPRGNRKGDEVFKYSNSKYISEEGAKMNKKTNSSFTRSEEQKKKQCMLTVDVDVFAMEGI